LRRADGSIGPPPVFLVSGDDPRLGSIISRGTPVIRRGRRRNAVAL